MSDGDNPRKFKGPIDKKKGPIDSGQSVISSFLLLALALTMIGILVFALNLNEKISNDSQIQITGLFSGKYLSIENFSSSNKSVNEKISTVTIKPLKAEAFQDQDGTGTREFGVLKEVFELDEIFAPNCSSKEPCGNVPREYFLTSTSSKYFDALALAFEVSEYDSENYDATLRLFVKQGTYRKDNRYHYDVYYFYKDNSVCKDTTRPSKCETAEEIEAGFEGWLEIPLEEDWEKGKFSVRLWNVLVDKAELYLEEK